MDVAIRPTISLDTAKAGPRSADRLFIIKSENENYFKLANPQNKIINFKLS